MNMKNKNISPLKYVKDHIAFDGVFLDKISANKKTPFYLYSKKTLDYYYTYFLAAAKKENILDPLVCYAVKANANLDVLKTLRKLGSGADVVSGGELKLAIEAGISPQKIVFSGVGKTAEEIRYALLSHKDGIYSFNVESIEELVLIQEIAKEENKIARVAFRLNPQVNVQTHKHIATGNKTHKFGLLKEDILKAITLEPFWTKNIELVGLSIHIGSQLTDMQATGEAIKELSSLALKTDCKLEFLDVGGGLGIDYTDSDRSKITSIDEYMKVVSSTLNRYYFSKTTQRPRIVFEPGRIIVAKMGVLVTKVIRTKTSNGKHFTIIDAGMNDFIRPALYEAHHEIYPFIDTKNKIISDIVGPVCETSDCFGEGREISPTNAGDLIVINNAGAYGHTMASTYNERPKIKEYFV
jgi:diaminopimelate decarboxylase